MSFLSLFLSLFLILNREGSLTSVKNVPSKESKLLVISRVFFLPLGNMKLLFPIFIVAVMMTVMEVSGGGGEERRREEVQTCKNEGGNCYPNSSQVKWQCCAGLTCVQTSDCNNNPLYECQKPGKDVAVSNDACDPLMEVIDTLRAVVQNVREDIDEEW